MARRILKWAAVGLGGLLIAVLATLAGGYGFLQTETGRTWAAGMLREAVGNDVSFDALAGDLPFAPVIRGLRLGDAQGVWLDAETVELVLAPWDLLAGNVTVERLAVASPTLYRLPAGGQDEETGDAALPWPPPVAIHLEDLTIVDFTLGADVLGEAATIKIAGHAALTSARAEIALTADRTDDVPGALRLEAGFAPGEDVLVLDLAYDEPAGGMLARVLDLPGAPAVTARAAGEGPLSDWRGTFDLAAGDLLSVDLAARIAGEKSRRLTAEGGVAVDPRLLGAPAGPEISTAFNADTTFEDGRIDIAEVAVESDLAALRAAGTIDGDAQITATIEAADLANWRRLTGADLSGRARIEAGIAGPLAAPQIDARLALDDAAAGDLRLAAAMIEIGLGESGLRDVTVRGTVDGLTSAGRDIVEHAEFAATVRADDELDVFEVGDLRIAADAFTVEAAGQYDPTKTAVPFDVSVHITDPAFIERAANVPLRGTPFLTATGEVDPATGILSAGIEGGADDLSSEDAVLAAALGSRLVLSGRIDRDDSGFVTIRDGKIGARRVALGLGAKIAPDFAAGRINYRAAAELAEITRATGLDVAGRAGAMGSFDLAAGKLTVDAEIDGAAYNGEPLGPVEAAFVLDLSVPNRLAFSDLVIDAAGQRLTGALGIDLDTVLADGRLVLDAPDLGRLPVGDGLAGVAQADILLTGDDGRQQATVEAAARGLQGGGIAVAALDLSATLDDLLGTPTGNLKATAQGVVSGDQRIEQVSLTARPDGDGFAFTLGADGSAPAMTLDSAGLLRLDPAETRLRIDRLDAAIEGLPVTLGSPLEVRAGESEIVLEGLDLRAADGRLTGNLAIGGQRFEGTLRADALSLTPLLQLAGQSPQPGRLDGTLSLGGGPAAPSARLDARLDFSGDGGAPAALDVDGRWQDGALDLTARLGGLFATPLTAVFSLPLGHDPSSGAPALDENAPIRGTMAGEGQLAALESLVSFGSNRADGRIVVDLSVGGMVAAPQVNGRATIDELSVENLTSGFLLRDGTVEIASADGRRLDLTLSGNDGGDGRIELDGAIDVSPDGGFPLQAVLTLQSVHAARRDDAIVVVSGEGRVEGPLDALSVVGAFTVDRADIRIPDRLPVTITEIDYVDINCPSCPATGETTAPKAAGPAAALAVDIDIPNRFFVRGRGLESEWQGQLAIRGTSSAPQITGQLSVIDGRMDLIGTPFTLDEGRILFGGAVPPDPTIDVAAVATRDGVTGTVHLAGRAASPDLSLTSVPALPEDEILARLLFGEGRENLSPAQALELANAVATLSGQGGGSSLLDKVRRGLGVDVLSVGQDEGGASLNVGSYIAEDLFVSYRQGLAGSGGAVVEYEIFEDFKIESDIGPENQSNFGINWELDY